MRLIDYICQVSGWTPVTREDDARPARDITPGSVVDVIVVDPYSDEFTILEKRTVLSVRHRRAFAEIEARDGEYVRNFEEMANRLHDAIMALQLEEDEDREEIFDAVRDTLTDELYNFVYGNMTFNLTFCEGGVNLDWWEASTC